MQATRLGAWVAALTLSVTPLALRAQLADGWNVGLAVGVFAAFPDDFQGAGCATDAGGVTAMIARAVAPFASVEASATATGEFRRGCTDAPVRLPTEGEVYTRSVMDERIGGPSFLRTGLSTLIEPLSDAPASPRLRVGVGRIWSKGLWTWSYGAGMRFRIGAHALVLDAERWNLDYDVRVETWTYHETADDDLESALTVRRSPRPVLVRIGWELGIG